MEFERDHLALLLRVNQILNSSLQIDEVLERLIEQVVEALGAERGLVLLRQDQHWSVAAARSLDPQEQQNALKFSRGIIDKVASEGQGMVVLNAMGDPRFSSSSSITLMALRSVVCAPLRWGGQVRGVVHADHRLKEGAFTQEHLELLGAIADQAARALENAELYGELQRVHQLSIEQARRELAENKA